MSDFYPDGQTGARSTARIVAAGAAAVVALCVTFLAGYAAHGRSGAPIANPTTRTPAQDVSTSSSATGAAPPATTQPPAATGPLHRNSAGVIAGYGHDQAGAVAATGNYTAALYIQTNRTHTHELTVLSSIATSPADAARMADDFSSEDAALAKILDVADLQAPGVIAYGHPLGYRVESVTTSTATIDVYVAGGQGVAGTPSDAAGARETFYEVDQVQLMWQDGDGADWRLKNWSHLVQNNGPELATVAAENYLPFPIGQTVPAASGAVS